MVSVRHDSYVRVNTLTGLAWPVTDHSIGLAFSQARKYCGFHASFVRRQSVSRVIYSFVCSVVSADFQPCIYVPPSVLNELDGLAKGGGQSTGHHLDDSPEHITMVTRHANQALAYLEHEFKAKNCHLRVQTSKGSVLETLAFRSEESDNSVSMDFILILGWWVCAFDFTVHRVC